MKRLAKWMGILISVLFLSGSAWGYDVFNHVKAAGTEKAICSIINTMLLRTADGKPRFR